MKLKELIKEIEENGIYCLNVFGNEVKSIPVKRAIGLIKQLDEPQPVKVQQFVADWYEKKKHDLNHYIWDYIYNWNHQEESEFKRWMNCSITSFQTLVNMHQFGYEVEKEKRYRVKIKNVYHGDLGHAAPFEQFSFYTRERNRSGIRYEFTRKELEEAGFGWVFNCSGIEVQEVD